MTEPAPQRDPRDGMPGLTPPRPLPLKDRSSIIFIEYGQIDVIDGAFVVIDANGVRTQIPVGGFVCLMLEPGTRLSHAAAALAARAGTLIVFVGEAGVPNSIPPANPVVRARIGSCIRRSSRSMRSFV